MCFNFFKKDTVGGALLDDRLKEEKEKDYKFEEIVAETDSVIWKGKSEYRRFPIFDQNNSYTCVAMTLAKVLGIMHQINEGEWITFSPGYFYQQRANRPRGGMSGIDAWNIARKNGALIEDLFPSQKKTDTQIDTYEIKDYEKDLAQVFKVKNYIILPTKDIDTIASVIQKTGKGVMVWFYFSLKEWKKIVPIVYSHSLTPYSITALRHSVTAVDYTLYNGKKALIIDDSWGFGSGMNGQRIITEDFFKERNFFASYPINFVFQEEEGEKPKHQFNRNLEYGILKDPDVVALQNCLKWEGLFPLNTTSTGNYYSITAKAVLDFWKKYNIATQHEIVLLKGRRVGAKTRTKLNELFS